jgi:hypothetical protein
MKKLLRSALRPILRPIWHRVWVRIEHRGASVEAQLKLHESRLAALEGECVSEARAEAIFRF